MTIKNRMRFCAQAIQLSEAKDGKPAEVSRRVQIMRTGTFKHPSYGRFSVEESHLQNMVKNLKENVRGIDLAIDYNHESDKEAAAWIANASVEKLEKGGHGLFAEVEWTPPAEEKLRNKEFKYLSGDFTLSYTDPETTKNHGATLYGAGLTNRPFIKGMDAVIQLSENPNDTQGEDEMTDLEKAQAAQKAAEDKAAEATKKLSEAEAKVKDLEKKEADRAAKEEGDKKLAEKKGEFDKMLSEKKVVEAQREPFMAGDFTKFAALAGPAPKDKKLSENEGGGSGSGDEEGDAQDKIIKLAEKLVDEKKAKDQEAGVRMILKDPAHKKLADEYRNLLG